MGNITDILNEFENKLSLYSPEEKETIMSAARWAEGMHHNQKRASGEDYFIHPLNVAEILVNLRLDYQAIVAALLHDVLEDTQIGKQELKREFGKEITMLVSGVTKISDLRAKSKTIQEAETIRKMLFAMVKDIRVILIKLADKLHNMRTLHYLEPDRIKRIATECLDIYAPLAGRLGISWIKDELEDLSLKYLRPQIYEQIKKFVAGKRSERAAYLEAVKKAILFAAEQAKIRVEVKTRAKHFYSIFLKHKKQGKSLEEIYDLMGIRILCETPVECYTLLGIVHKLWIPKAERFKDYIAMPKSNMYQSLHTTVVCYDGKLIEIQIRTFEMNQTAENGIAAHWLYKKGLSNEVVSIHDLPIINKLRTWDKTPMNSTEFLEEIKHELLKDLIYVFTPRGDVIELPAGATAIDFAYHIHTEVGNHCMAAKADGSVIPLRKALKNGQVVEIITSQNAKPKLNWLRDAKTARTRSKIRHWINQNDAEVFIDQSIIARRKVVHKDHPLQRKKRKFDMEKRIFDPARVGVKVDDEKNVLLRFAKCCTPMIGDPIIGYISRGRGIIVHKANCSNLKYIPGIEERKIDVEWETVAPVVIKQFKITVRQEIDLFSVVETAIRRYDSNLIGGNIVETDSENRSGIFSVEVKNEEIFRKIIKKLRTMQTILNIQTKGFGGHELEEE